VSNLTVTPKPAAAALAGTQVGNYPSSAFLFISEYGSALNDGSSGSSYPRCPTVADQVVAYGAISAVSAPFNPATRAIRVHTTGICAVRIGGKAPVAVAGLVGGAGRMPANAVEFYAVAPGDALAVIATQ
jgi:hypothetical protein